MRSCTNHRYKLQCNNKAEMYVVLLVLRHLLSVRHKLYHLASFRVFTDSQYCLGILVLGHDVGTDHTLAGYVLDCTFSWNSYRFSVNSLCPRAFHNILLVFETATLLPPDDARRKSFSEMEHHSTEGAVQTRMRI